MKKRLAIIDADSMIYIVAYKFRTKKVANMVKINLNQFISELLNEAQATHYIGFFGASDKKTVPNFRYAVDPDYKKNRPETPDFITKWRPTIHQEMEDHWGFAPVMGIEADDAVAIAKAKYEGEYDEIVIITADKDLKQIPGTIHFDMNKHKFTEIDTITADRFFAEQMLKGDTTDNIKGIPGIGPKRAADLVSSCTTSVQLKWMVIRMYKEQLDKVKVQPDIQAEAEEEWTTFVAANPDVTNYSTKQLERQKRLFISGAIKRKQIEKRVGGWKDYIKQQYTLLRMLDVAPEGFEVPEPTEFELFDRTEVNLDDENSDLLGL